MIKAADNSHYCRNDSNNNIHSEEIEIVRKISVKRAWYIGWSGYIKIFGLLAPTYKHGTSFKTFNERI
jgi:hypothetical protein